MGVGKRAEEKGKLSSLSVPPLSVLFLCSRLISAFELLLLKRNKNHVWICRWQQLQKSPCNVCNVGGER